MHHTVEYDQERGSLTQGKCRIGLPYLKR